MRALLGQLDPVPGDVDANARAVAEAITARPHVDIAVFPELFLCGYAPDRAAEVAVDAEGPELALVAEAAAEAETAVIVGFAERLPHGVGNAAACFDEDGRLAAIYHKTHLFGAAERASFVAGDALCVAEVAGVQVAPLICFDVEFPEPARAVSRAGAELLVTLAANPEPYAEEHAVFIRARALDNRRPHLYVNHAGLQSGLRFGGGSAAVTADGHVVAAAGAEPTLLEVDLDVAGPATEDVDYLSQIRSDLEVERPHFSPIEGGTR